LGKAPAFQFYVRDWLSDPQLRAASTVSKGIWIDLLCFMWEAPDRGKLEGVTREQLAKMTGATPEEIEVFLSDAKTLNFGSVTERDKKITLENRRMVREEKERKANAERQARFRDKKKSLNNAPSNGKVTSLSSSSTSVTPPKPPTGGFDEFWKSYPKKVGKGAAESAFKKIKKPKETLRQILQALERQKRSEQWTKENGRFIPNPATYLNQRRWEDELEAPANHDPLEELIHCDECGCNSRPVDVRDGKCPACGETLKGGDQWQK